MRQGTREHRSVPAFQESHEAALPLRRRLSPEQERARRRRDEQRDAQRGEGREHVRRAERRKDLPGDAGEKEHRDEHERDQERRVHDGAPHLERGVEDHGVAGCAIRTVARELQAPVDVFDVDDRVVHDLAERDGEASEGHDVDGRAEQPESDQRRQERQRYRDEADHGGAEVEEEQQENGRDEPGADPKRNPQVADCPLDERSLAEEASMEDEPRGQVPRRRIQGRLQLGGDLEGVHAGLPRDEHHHRRRARRAWRRRSGTPGRRGPPPPATTGAASSPEKRRASPPGRRCSAPAPANAPVGADRSSRSRRRDRSRSRPSRRSRRRRARGRSRAARSGGRSTWFCATRPPYVTTLEMPGTARILGFSVQSAKVRAAIGSKAPLDRQADHLDRAGR